MQKGGYRCSHSASVPDPQCTAHRQDPVYLGFGQDRNEGAKEEEATARRQWLCTLNLILTIVTCPPLYKEEQGLLREGRWNASSFPL